MKALVIGAAGFVGSHVLERLLRERHDMVGLDNFDDFYDPAIKESNLSVARDHASFAEVRGTSGSPSLLSTLPDDIGTILHFAARAGVRPSIERPVLYSDVNVMGTIRILEFARNRGIHRFLFASSSSVYGNKEQVPFSEDDPVDNPISPHATTKRPGELLCHASSHLYGISCIWLRLCTVYGLRSTSPTHLAIHKFTRLMSAGEEVQMFGDRTTQRDYT